MQQQRVFSGEASHKGRGRAVALWLATVAFAAAATAIAIDALAAGVVPDGGTETTVTTGAGGRTTVGIANPVGGVSTNTYREFNVPRAGVDLDNRAAQARTILNQVTSTSPSVLEGPLSVLGTTHAHVIVANPNGISVNGLTVHGVGNLALTTGQVTFNDFNTANGQLQRNLVIQTGQGAIEVGADGLSGTLLNLELVAKQIRVGGPVTNLYSNPNARVRAVAGSSRAEIDTSVSPTDNLTPWITYSAAPGTAGQSVAIDITAAGSLSSGRVELLVTDQGAGVRHAGSAFATAGDFVVSGSGDLLLASGKISAKQDVLIGSGGFIGTGDVSAGRYIQVASDRVDLLQATLAAGTSAPGDLVIGAKGQVHSQPVRLTDATLAASGGIGIFDAGAGVILSGTEGTAGGNVVVAAPTLTTQAGSRRSALTSSAGTVTIETGDATLASTDLDGVAGTGIRAQSLTLQDATVQSSGGGIAIETRGSFTQHDSHVLAATDVRLHAGSVVVDSTAMQSTLVAKEGGVLIQSDADLANTGGLIQGQTRIAGESASGGAVTVLAGGNVTNLSTPTYLGILFGAADDVEVSAGGNVVNRYARMLSNGYLRIHADGDVSNEIGKQAGANAGQPTFYSASGRRWLVLSKRGAGFDVDYGSTDRPDQIAYLLSDKGTTISGRNVTNYGGEIYANDGPIRISATNTFRTEGVATGTAHFKRSCLIFCRASASSTTAVTGGLLSAGGDIEIQAGKAAINAGGQVMAMGDLTVTAPVTYATGITGYTAIARGRGFKAFFGDTWARLYAMDVGGSWMARGHTQIDGDTVADGGSFDGAVTIAGNATVTRPRQRDPVTIENHLGLTSWFWR
ncbi:filamentous hemagglutinin N-terminal domain-containing protein [Cupriavidus sp. NPDC089707]|uniref:two-partner secretion domain-containing protein n=1 Tax=Cupriavidus sp. NPDC089707 TaxID=3363963 RepID=UPI00382F7DE1